MECPLTSTYYRDADGDGYGNLSDSVTDSSQPAGYVTDNTDCDDNEAAANPGANEICDGIDNNCDGQIDEGCGGVVWAWGENLCGQLGDGTNTNSNVPVPVSGLVSIAAIAGGAYHTIALKIDGTVWAWGDNVKGQLGDGTNTASNVPFAVSGLANVTAIAGDAYHTIAIVQ